MLIVYQVSVCVDYGFERDGISVRLAVHTFQ